MRLRRMAAALRAMAEEGLAKRLASPGPAPGKTAAEYWERLEFELGIIQSMKFPGYFLIVADFIRWSKSQGIPVGPGRGSGAGSLVAYATTITDLDPLATICCSSASSIRNACRCPTSTSISARTAAKR
jgi:DNA polymerase-3 subunit alpha